MPVIVETGSNTFKFIEDGRAPDASANYTYVRADEWPQQLQYMLDRDYDTTPSSGNALTAPAPSAARGRGPQAQGSSQSGGRSVSRSAGPVGAGGNSYAQRDRTASLDRTSQPLVNQAGGSQPQRAQGTAHGLPLAAWEQSPGIPPTASPWLEYTPPGENASPQMPNAPMQGGGALSQPATYGAEPNWETFEPTQGGQIYPNSNGAQPIPSNWFAMQGRGDPTQSPGGPAYDPRAHAAQRASLAGNPELDQGPRSFDGFDPTAGWKYPPGSSMYPAQGYDFGRLDPVMEAIQNGSFIPGIPTIQVNVPPYQR